jgi:magnesium chelatase family protein
MTLCARRDGRAFVLPAASAAEAALVRDAVVHPAASLLAVCAHLAAREALPAVVPGCIARAAEHCDLADVRGQTHAKRALEIAAAGGHSMLMEGPPGTGKSMLAQRLPSLLPPLADEEALEVASIASIAGRFTPERWGLRPFRCPHHTASGVALVGGGSNPRPGEISLAHHGVLFLDELPEWDRRVLEVLREPLESGVIHISRAARHSTFPAQFQLVAAMNPCPCGWLGDASARCRCTPDQVARYRSRVSGPLMDRIDLSLEVASLSPEELVAADSGAAVQSSDAVRTRVVAARERQSARQGKCNARLAASEVALHCRADAQSATMLAKAMKRQRFSARAYHRVLKVARTIADLAGVEDIGVRHVAEALSYRRDAAATESPPR